MIDSIENILSTLFPNKISIEKESDENLLKGDN